MARAALGDDVVDHYLNYARTEQRLFDEVVTCYERERMYRAWLAERAARSGSRATRRTPAGASGRTPAALIPLDYVQAVERAGGRALLVPPSLDGVEETLDALDGLLFSGGPDLDPACYGAEAHPETNGVRPERDRAELRCSRPPSRATCPSWPSAAGARS